MDHGGDADAIGSHLQLPAFAKERSFKPVLSQRLAGGMSRVGKQQLLRSKQKAGCGVSPERLKRRTVSLNQCTEMVRQSWQAQNSLDGTKESGLHLPHLLASGCPERKRIGAASSQIAKAQCSNGRKVRRAWWMNETTDHVAVLSGAGECLSGLCVPAQTCCCYGSIIVFRRWVCHQRCKGGLQVGHLSATP